MPKTASKPQKSVTTTKAAKIIGLLRRNNGATISELTKATSWQAHSVRGFLSGALKKRKGLPVSGQKDEAGVMRYRIGEGMQ